MASLARYGVREQRASCNACDRTIEQLDLLGFAVLDGGYSPHEIAAFSAAFERAEHASREQHRDAKTLELLDERHIVRLPMFYDRLFLNLATNAAVLEVCRCALGHYFVLNQQNAVTNPAAGSEYRQAAYHRDLPHQHFVSSRPLAISALFCVDAFTAENGATLVVPGSHKQESFPSDDVVEAVQVQIAAPAGSFIVFNSMIFHSGGMNRTARIRRGVNHVFTVPVIKPQIDLPGALGETFTDDADLRQLLGYNARVPSTIAGYYESRRLRSR
jgi:ectoine hydroxylase-related dioxygenase (phytanoyl-CoA dioxygenase family)